MNDGSLARLDRVSSLPWPLRVATQPSYRQLTVAVAGVVVLVGLTLLAIGARSPYTHANLSTGYDPRYERTQQILVGPPAPFAGVSRSTAGGDDAAARGASLYVTAGCATCHGLAGQGAPVGPPIAGMDSETVSARIREGPAGMPRFSLDGLSAEQVADIAAYLSRLDPVK